MEKKWSALDVVRAVALVLLFAGCTVVGFMLFGTDEALADKTEWQQRLFPLGLALLMGGTVTATFWKATARRGGTRPVWFYPALSAFLTLWGLGIAYIYLGIWPIGEKSCMLVDMHHQYAPLLAKLRDMLMSGDSFLYSFELGIGASVLPAFGYYLASPLNLLLVLFPEHLLTEGILVITLIKNMLIAAGMAACLQYVYRRRSPAVVAVSLMFSMMMYVLAYSWNIMWLDAVMMLPLVVMGFEHLMRHGKYLPYVLSLAYALYANYYIAFMLCIFLVLYYFAFLLRERRSAALNRQATWRFTVGSLMGGGLAAFMVLPVFLALGQTSAAGGKLPDIDAYFDIFNMLGRQLYAVSPTIRSGKMPNLYCGVAVLLLVPLFAMNKGIPRRRRMAYMGLFAVMSVSLVVNQFNLVWHGLHAPNDLPYRFSFINSFLLVLLSYEALAKARYLEARQIVGALLGVVAYLVLEERFGDSNYKFITIYVSLLLVAVYAAITFLLMRYSKRRQVWAMVLLAVVSLEMSLNASRTIITLNSQEHYTGHYNYVDNLETAAARAAVDAMKKQVASDGQFSRMEFLPRRSFMDTAMYDYPGITSFASSNSYRTTRFMAAMGYAANGINSYTYRSFVAPSDSVLGIRYVALKNTVKNDLLELVDTVTVPGEDDESETYYIYKNGSALPLGYRVNSAVKTWESSFYNPMDTINSLYSAMTGGKDVLVAMPIAQAEDDYTNTDIKGTCGFYFDPDNKETLHLVATTDVAGQYYMFVDCRGADDLTVRQGGNSWSPSEREPYFVDLGYLEAGEIMEAEITSDSACSGNVYAVRVDAEAFGDAIATLKADGLCVTDFDDAHIKGTVDASAAGTMLVSIPYDAGWTVKVDGKSVATYGLDAAVPSSEDTPREASALLGFDLPAGKHTVELTFRTRGLAPGLVITFFTLLLLVAFCLFTGRFAARVKDHRFGWVFATNDLTPGDPYAADGDRVQAPPPADGMDDVLYKDNKEPGDLPVLLYPPQETADKEENK